ENCSPFVRGAGCDGAIDFAGEDATVLCASAGVLEASIVPPFRFAECAAEIRPIAVALDHHEVNPSRVGASIGTPQRIDALSARLGLRRAAGHQPDGEVG